MNTYAMAQKTSRLQKQYFKNLFDTLTLVEDAAERTSGYWFEKLGLKALPSAMAPYVKVRKQGRLKARKCIVDAFDNLDACLSGFDPRRAEPTDAPSEAI